jgi:predicted small metal-binding protein
MAPRHVEREERVMGKVVNCECGEVVRAESEGELVSSVEEHVARNHPELVGKLSREDILGMSEEE